MPSFDQFDNTPNNVTELFRQAQGMPDIAPRPRQRVTSVSIASILLRDSGTYNDQFVRPYFTEATGDVVDGIKKAYGATPTGKVTPGHISGVASSFLKLRASPESSMPAQIANGWSEKRVIFIMHVIVSMAIGGEVSYYIQGYTDYTGLTLSGAIDPEMTFYVNNIVSFRSIISRSPYTSQPITRNQMLENQHVFTNADNYNGVNKQLIRPTDVCTTMVTEAMSTMADMENTQSITNKTAEVISTPLASKRSNTLPGEYLSNLINGFMIDTNAAAPWESDFAHYNRMLGYSGISESDLVDNPLLMAISRANGGLVTGWFKYKDLAAVDPRLKSGDTSAITYVSSMGMRDIGMHNTGQSDWWHGGDVETMYASMITQAVPSLMMELMIGGIKFTSTNMIDGQIQTILAAGASFERAAAGMGADHSADQDMIRFYNAFAERFSREVMYGLSYQGAQLFNVYVESSVYGETIVEVNIENRGVRRFVTPSFCDGLFAPVLTYNQDLRFSIAHDVDTLLREISSPRPSMPVNRSMSGNYNF